MKPGKARRLECCDVFGCLKIRIDKLGPKNVEAAALKVDLEDVEIKNNCLYISVKSLNHAYTTASLRLEPHRRSHGGKIYDHIGLKKEEGFVSLEIVRSDYENQMWNKIISAE